jgi:hypothetical protein
LRGTKGDVSKLQTAFRNGVISGAQTARAKMRRGWMSRAEERRMFEPWDRIFREIREKNVLDGVHVRAPDDTRLLRETNVIRELKLEHGARRRIPVNSA